MNVEDLNMIASKIASEGIEVNDKNYLRDIYNLDDFNKLFSEFDCLIDKIKYKKQENTLIFFLGLFNLIDSSKIKLLCEIPKLKSFNLLKGGLIKYFIGNLDITIESYEIPFKGNYLSRINQWFDYKIRPIRPLFLLMRWIYFYDKELFFELLFMEKSNYIFLTFVHGGIVENLDFEEKYIQFDCNDEIKLYAIFYYFINPIYYLQYYDVENFKSNLDIIMKIPLNFLMKIVLDYIRFDHVKVVPIEFINMINENDTIFYKTFNCMKLKNIRELKSFLFLLDYGPVYFQEIMFKIILKKFESLLLRQFISVEINDLKLIYERLSKEQISKVILLLIKIKENLVYVSEFDLQIRYKKYLTDIHKYNKLNDLIKFSLSLKEIKRS